jgi:hypothetical protein
MKASYDFFNDVGRRTIRIRMTGEFDVQTIERFGQDYRAVSREYAGQPHFILADMRGTAPIAPDVAPVFGEIMTWSRRHGVVCCVHCSDDTVQRLQAARLGRMSSPEDDLTVDVVSLDEGERVLAEAMARLEAQLHGV